MVYLHFKWFCNIKHWSCGKYWFSESCRQSQCWHGSIYNISNSHFSTTTDLEALDNCQAHHGRNKTFKILICAWRLKYCNQDKYCHLFSLKWQANISLWEVSVKYQVWTTIVCHSYFQVNTVFQEKSSWFKLQLKYSWQKFF